MVAPLIPLAIGGSLGLVGGMWLGKGKKEYQIQETYAPTITYHKPFETYSPQIQYAPQISYGYQGATYIISSPYAESKKSMNTEQISKPEQRGEWEIPQVISPTISPQQTGTSGTNFVTIAIIGAIALIGYGIVSKRRK